MAVSSTSPSICISRRQNYPSSTRTCSSSSSPFSVSIPSFPTTTKPLIFTIRSTTDDASAETVATATQTERESDTPIELPKGPPSVISTLNVERALRGIPITDVDYYGSLGIQKGCSNDQVSAAYKNKIEELANKGLDEEELSKKLEILKESYFVLSSAQERRLYDWSLARMANPDNYLWPYEVDNSKKSTETPEQVPEDVGPTRIVGYVFVAWLILAFTLSIALNR